MSARIIDTETTDVDLPDVIQLAYTATLETPRTAFARNDVELKHYRPRKPISLGAMATHHIIADDLVDADLWCGRWCPEQCAYIVGHNVDFDWKAIGSPDIKRICTLALARYLWPKNDSHTLSACIYSIYPHPMARELVRSAHNAQADVDLCGRLLFAITDALQPRDWAHLYELSEKARVPTIFTWGKHKGRAIAEVKQFDRSYISWCLSGKCDAVNDDPYMRKALV
jgi:exodeoxyribonuclease X